MREEARIKVRKADSMTHLGDRRNPLHLETPRLCLNPAVTLVSLTGISTSSIYSFDYNRMCGSSYWHNQEEKTVIIPIMCVCERLINYS